MRYFALVILIVLYTSVGYCQDETDIVPPIAWEIQRYNGFPPRQLWLSLEGQPAEVFLTGGFHDSAFSPDRQKLAYIYNGLVVESFFDAYIHTTTLEASEFGYPFGFTEKPEPPIDRSVSAIGVKWMDTQRLLFNAMDVSSTSMYRRNHMDLQLYDVGTRQHVELFADDEGGWAFPDPTGRFVALFNDNTIRLFDSANFTQPRESLVFEAITGSPAFGVGYPTPYWSADGNRLLFNVAEDNVNHTCTLITESGALYCGDFVPMGGSNYTVVSDQLETIATANAGEIIISQRSTEGTVQEIARIQHPNSPQIYPVRWLDNQTLLYRTIIDFCTESINPAPSQYFEYSLESGELSPWLDGRFILASQQINETLFAVASGDCHTVTVGLYDVETQSFNQLAQMAHPNKIFWFRFVEQY